MTEEEWLTCPHVIPMAEFLENKLSPRKMGLFACACCRRIWHLLTDERSRRAVEVAERFADGQADKQEWYAADLEATEAADDAADSSSTATEAVCNALSDFTQSDAWEAVHQTSADVAYALRKHHKGKGRQQVYDAELAAHPELLRDLVGNPFRPVVLDPAWFAPTVVALARTIYEERAFDRLPILADALQDAGCDNGDVLTHCQGPGQHVRGCWVVDLLLGKR